MRTNSTKDGSKKDGIESEAGRWNEPCGRKADISVLRMRDHPRMTPKRGVTFNGLPLWVIEGEVGLWTEAEATQRLAN